MLFQEIKAIQGPNLFAGLAMQQALHIMQLPVLDLADWLIQEIERNPVLERTETRSYWGGKSSPQEDLRKREFPASPSLSNHLLKQVSVSFEDPRDRVVAEQLIGHFNRRGFLDIPLEEVTMGASSDQLRRVLAVVQTFDPIGVGAYDVRESLLIQLRAQGKESALAFQVVNLYFEELLHNQMPLIAKGLGVDVATLAAAARRDIMPLDPYPGNRFSAESAPLATPDVTVTCIDGVWHIDVTVLPCFRVTAMYAEALRKKRWEKEELAYVRKRLAEGRWLHRALNERSRTLKRLVRYLLRRQAPLFAGEGRLEPMTMPEVAQALGVHVSTVARAVAGKLLACPQGMFPLRSFFSQAVSQRRVEEKLSELIHNEDKQRPLSDAELAKRLQAAGMGCARRTVSKYRSRMSILSAARRKKWLLLG